MSIADEDLRHGAPAGAFDHDVALGRVPVDLDDFQVGHAALLQQRLGACGEAPAARLWACEQALRCAEVAAVLAWLPRARVGELRRLQLAAAQHESLLFVFRPESAAQAASR